jgi:hypothetical protein
MKLRVEHQQDDRQGNQGGQPDFYRRATPEQRWRPLSLHENPGSASVGIDYAGRRRQ